MGAFVSWIASYPRSGNTWVRALLLAYRQGESFDINRMEHIPGEPSTATYRTLWSGENPYTNVDYGYMRPIAIRHMYDRRRCNPFVLKTHTANISLYGVRFIPPNYTNKALYIYRDPRDVLVSFSKYLGKSHEKTVEFMLNPNAKLEDKKSGIWQFISSYKNHVHSWMNEKNFPVMGIKYSDLLSDTGGSLISILKFFDPDIKLDMDRLKYAVGVTSLGRLKEVEKENGFRERPPEVNQFFGTSKGTWQGMLDEDIADRLMNGICENETETPKEI